MCHTTLAVSDSQVDTTHLIATYLPKEWTVFLQKSLQRTATGTAVQPDHDLIIGIGVLGWEEPEVKFARLVGILGDGQKPGVRLADIPVNVWDCGSINGEF